MRCEDSNLGPQPGKRRLTQPVPATEVTIVRVLWCQGLNIKLEMEWQTASKEWIEQLVRSGGNVHQI